MTMANEMTHLVGDVAEARSRRVAAIAGMRRTLRRQLRDDTTSRRVVMNRLTTSIKKDLGGIFSEAAVIRGRSVDMIQKFANEREDNAKALRAELDDYISDLEISVAKLLRDYGRARDEMGIRETDARETFMKGLRLRVHKLLTSLNADRARAGKIWRERGSTKVKAIREAEEKRAAKPPVAKAVEKMAADGPEPVIADKMVPKPATESKEKVPLVASAAQTPAKQSEN